ncbi:hypothetical protein Barb6_02884 [Bacteroidales bacterium Barb6]|nr:hypothetical protein Barb6_02884 [Bacteroidales bacterium Barb6]
MSGGSKIEGGGVAHVGEHLVSRTIDLRPQILHRSKAAAGYPHAENVFPAVTADGIGDEVEVFAVGRDGRMRQRSEGVFDDGDLFAFTPLRVASGRAVDFGGAGAARFDVLCAIGVVHCVAIGGDGRGTFVKLGVDVSFDNLRLEPFAFLVLFDHVEIVVALPRNGTDAGILVFRCPRSGKIQLVESIPCEHGGKFAFAGVEFVHATDGIGGGMLFHNGGEAASRATVKSGGVGGTGGQIFVVVFKSVAVASLLVVGLSETEIDDTVGIVVTQGVEIAACCAGIVIYQAIALRHAEGDVSTLFAFVGFGLGVNLAVDGSRLIVFPNSLLLFGIGQFRRFAAGKQQNSKEKQQAGATHGIK